MRFASAGAAARPDYIEVDARLGISVFFDPDAVPYIHWEHIDGPLLHMRNGQLHWLTWRERFSVWLCRDNEFTLERKHIPEFVERWLARATAEQRRLSAADGIKP
jgi:hypothetical protein